MPGITENKFRVTLTVDGRDFGVWDKFDGGKVGSNVATYTPGGGGSQQALAGTQTVDAVTLSRNYVLERDHTSVGMLLAKAGTGECVVKQTPLDEDGHAWGAPIVWTGILSEVQTPSHDSTSSNPAMIVLTVTPHGTVTA